MPPRGWGQGATGTPPCASSLLRAPPWTPGQLLQGGKWQVPVVWAHSPRPARRTPAAPAAPAWPRGTPAAPAAPAQPGRGRSAPCFGAGLHSASVKLAGQPATQPHVAVHGSCQKPRFPPLQCGVMAGPHKPGGCGAPGLQGEGVWPWRGRDCRRWWLGWTLSGAWPWLLLGGGASALQMGLGGVWWPHGASAPTQILGPHRQGGQTGGLSLTRTPLPLRYGLGQLLPPADGQSLPEHLGGDCGGPMWRRGWLGGAL